jgi:hypothetical protein
MARSFIALRGILDKVPPEHKTVKMLEIEPTVPATDDDAYELAARCADTISRNMPGRDMYMLIIDEERRRHTDEDGDLDREAYERAVFYRALDLTALSANLEAALDDNDEY